MDGVFDELCEERAASETHRLKCRIITLEAALREVTEYAELVGSETDEVHIAVIKRARATLTKGLAK